MKHLRMILSLLALVLVVGFAAVDAGAATIVINNLDGVGEGFNDMTPVAPVGGNPGVTLGQQRLNAFTYAAELAGFCLVSIPPIVVDARMDPLSCNATSAVLGSAGAILVWSDFPGAPLPATWYCGALANAKAGVDLDGGLYSEINARFNSSINGNANCLAGYYWYYGYDGILPGANYIDFISVVEHEILHGLGFQSFINVSTGAELNGPPQQKDVFETMTEHHGVGLFPALTAAQRAAGVKADPNLHFVGPNVTAGGVALVGGVSDGHVRLYGPATLAPGSTLSHWSTALTPNELMEPIYTGPNHSRGLAEALLMDIGWTIQCPVTVAISSFDARAVAGGVRLDAVFASTFDAVWVHVYRAEGSGQFRAIATEAQNGKASFSYVDQSAAPGTEYSYQIGVVDQDGEFMSPVQKVTLSATAASLAQNEPNPFNPTTSIRFTLASKEQVTLSIYDVSGRLVRSLVNEERGIGSHSVAWDGRDAAGNPAGSGLYFYRLNAGKFSDTKKMVLLK